MFDVFLFVLTAAVGGIILYHASRKKLLRRIEILERNTARYADAIDKMADVQSKTLEKFSRRFEELEERLLDLSVPSWDPEMPLEKRHRVLTLAKQGVPMDEIVERVKAPVGEAELILNLRKYQRGMKNGSASAPRASARTH